LFTYIKDRLARQINSGEVRVIVDTNEWYDRLARAFPTGINRIAWEQVASKKHVEVFSGARATSSDEVEEMLATHREMIARWFIEMGIEQNSEVVWVGDDSDCGLRMSLRMFLSHFPLLFSMPQHSYVLSDRGDWCLNYTMEGELFFGMNGQSGRRPT
jgi:hypothetical protein